MQRTETILFNGIKIFYTDFSNLRTEEEIDEIINKSTEYIQHQAEKSLFTLTNFENIYFNASVANKFTKLAKDIQKFVKANALIGISGLTKIMYDGIMRVTGRDSRTFNSMDEAKEYLLSRSHEIS
jgi:hypothetical protein